MTLEEKAAQLGGVWAADLLDENGFSAQRARERIPHGIGHVSRLAGGTGLRPAGVAAAARALQRFLRHETRLGIPALIHEEALAGFLARDADAFPQAIGLGATFDPDAVRRMAEVIREQMRAVGARLALAPVLDVARDFRWGRTEETYGESPFLVAALGTAYIQGLQGSDLSRGVAATAKHFLGYSAPEGGHNHKPAHIGPRELREVYGLPFLAAVREAGVEAVMNAYNAVDGRPCGAAPEILRDLLRKEFGFEGTVIADYFTTALLVNFHRVAAGTEEAARIALEAGIDVELPVLDAYRLLPQLVREGRVSEERIDEAVLRVLAQKARLGLFDDRGPAPRRATRPYQTPRTRALAAELARKSLVLLKNEGGVLPLREDLRRVAVIGPAADDARLLQGDYHYPAHLEMFYARQAQVADDILPRPKDIGSLPPGPYFPPMVTPLAALRERLPREVDIVTVRGCGITDEEPVAIEDAVAAAASADVALVFLGSRSGLIEGCTSGEFRDAASIDLPAAQDGLLHSVAASGTPTVLVLLSGRPLALTSAAWHAAAILYAWVPGEEGGSAIADVLLGRADPGGRLPVTLPRSTGQLPLHHDQHWDPGARQPFPADYIDLPAQPLFPFGHGLSYAEFSYEDLRIAPEETDAGGSVTVSVRIRNTSQRPGEDVVQLYLHDPVASVTRPWRRLAGFARVALAPGQRCRVRFELHATQTLLYDVQMRPVVEPGDIEVHVGASSADIRLSGRFRISGERRVVDPHPTPTKVRIRYERAGRGVRTESPAGAPVGGSGTSW